MLRIVCVIFCLVMSLPAMEAQVKGNKIKASAEAYFQNGKYAEAYNLYSKYQRMAPDDLSVLAPVGICQYHTSQIDEAVKNLRIVVVNTKKPQPLHLFYYGRALHMASEFSSAAEYYKKYLKATDAKDDRRAMVKDCIRRCGAGLRMSGLEELAVVENLGETVNSALQEFAPVTSPNYDNKLYISASRFNSIGGRRDIDGKQDDKYGSFHTDMYSTYENNGQWSIPEQLPGLLNSAQHDLVLDFVKNGQVIIFFKSNDMVSGQVQVDTFGRADQRLFPEAFHGPLDQQLGDGALYFYNDTTMLFASRRPGGFGGLDIYLARFSNGQWQLPMNLGPEVNSAYDDTHPFLAKDGRSLYFSSNRPSSMGGHDIFKARYNDQQEMWGDPQNLGAPINSPGDDGYFRLAQDGLKAYFSSERAGGFGEQDIYLAYFKQKRNEQTVTSRPQLFDEVPAYRREVRESGDFVSFKNEEAKPTTDPSGNTTITKYIFRPLYVGINDQVASPGNIQMMDKIKELMTANPQLRIMLTGHGDGKSPADFELYFSIKRAEKVAQYLISHDINANRILVRGVGVQYPYLKLRNESGPKINVDKYNRRIEYQFFGLEGSGIAVEMEKQKLRDNLKDPGRNRLIEMEKGLYYRVQVASVRQNFNGLGEFANRNWLVERHKDNKSFRYLVGHTTTYREAQQLTAQVAEAGQPGAFVVPYIDGQRLRRSEILQLAGQYPDLQFYLGADD